MDMLNIIKKAAMEALEASKPTAVIEGKVVSVSPLKINVSQMQTLDSTFLVLCEAVKDHEIEVTVDWNTETTDSHKHSITGKKKVKVHSGLKKGDKVLMIRAAGGQKFYVVGRL